MNLINKCFRIITPDEELIKQFPELTPGTEFKVIETGNEHVGEDADGIIAVQIKNGPYIHVKSRESWFWCLFCEDTMNELEEIPELASDQYPAVDLSNLYQGAEMPDQLEAIADELNDWNAGLVTHAAYYIRQLEAKLKQSDKAF